MKPTNLDSQINSVGVQAGTLTAGGTGDGTEVTSASVDRAVAGGNMYLSAVLAIAYKASLTAAETLKYTVKISDSDDDSSYSSDVTLLNAVTVMTGAKSAVSDVKEIALDLSGYKRYVKFKITPDLSKADTDVASWGATLVLGGASSLPV